LQLIAAADRTYLFCYLS